MMLDTGASVTVFDESVSKTLGIRFLGEGNVHGPGQGPLKNGIRQSHTLMFGGKDLEIKLCDSASGMVLAPSGRRTDGFLGSNVFRNYVVEIDYANQVLRLTIRQPTRIPAQVSVCRSNSSGRHTTVRAEVVRKTGQQSPVSS